MVLAEFFIWFNTFTFHNNGDGPTLVFSAETMLDHREGGKKVSAYRRAVAVVSFAA